jgi:Cd(II)/Pb(II)-responsive transcriptional regulator
MPPLESLQRLQSQEAPDTMAAMKIGQLASATGTPVQTIRYYESEGLLPNAPRSEGNYRIYDRGHQQRLAFIRHCRALDMTLDEIRVLLRGLDAPHESCDAVNAALDAHIGHVTARVRELNQLRRQLEALRRRCAQAQDAAHCGILQELSTAGDTLPPARAHDCPKTPAPRR